MTDYYPSPPLLGEEVTELVHFELESAPEYARFNVGRLGWKAFQSFLERPDAQELLAKQRAERKAAEVAGKDEEK